MIIQKKAYARAGLIGNPSDGYWGKTISILVRNFAAEVTCYESPHITIIPGGRDRLEFDSLENLVDDIRDNGYYGGIRLIKASIRAFHTYCQEFGISLDHRNFTLAYETDIPVRVGLAGSSGIVTATMRALMAFYNQSIEKPVLANLILSVEVNELGIAAGLQDRVIQVYQGVVFMDFERSFFEKVGYGRYEYLPSQNLPSLFIAYHAELAEGTEVPHSSLRSRFDHGNKRVMNGMLQFAQYAQDAYDLIKQDRGAEIGPLMDANFDLRAELCIINPGNLKLVRTGRDLGAHVKFAGSGGAVIGVYDGDPNRLTRLKQAYEAFGARLVVPRIEEAINESTA